MRKLARGGALVLGLILVGACGDDGGDDVAAYCEVAEEAADASASDPAVAFQAFGRLAEAAPSEVADDFELLVDALEALGDPDAATDEDAVEAASQNIFDFTEDECGVDLEAVTGGGEVDDSTSGDGSGADSDEEPVDEDTGDADDAGDDSDDSDADVDVAAAGAGCELLTDEEVESAFDDAIEEVEGDEDRCRWISDGGRQIGIFRGGFSFILAGRADDPSSLAELAADEGYTEIRDLGEVAWFDDTTITTTRLLVVLSDDELLSLEFTFFDELDADTAESLGRAVLERL